MRRLDAGGRVHARHAAIQGVERPDVPDLERGPRSPPEPRLSEAWARHCPGAFGTESGSGLIGPERHDALPFGPAFADNGMYGSGAAGPDSVPCRRLECKRDGP